MPRPLPLPETDPAPIFELFRGSYGTELLTAAVHEFNVFGRLAAGPKSMAALGDELQLAERPAVVLFSALRAMRLLEESGGKLSLAPLAREHLTPGGALDISGYIGLAADTPGVRRMIACLRSNRPTQAADDKPGTAFIYRSGVDSAMEREASARALTLALAGRARNVAPVLARSWPLDGAKHLLDVGGGTGLYSIAWLERHATLRATVWDRPEVLKVAAELAAEQGVHDRLQLAPGDMFADPVPAGADVALLCNVLHDWDVDDCRRLIARVAAALPAGGWLLIHDVLLNDALDGPLPIALYSAALFSITEGRAYSGGEYRAWLMGAGLRVEATVPTLAHASLIAARKPTG
ncbi:MAG: methyltransferase domain-containing protein [Planctomycetes bacterium]|nr:methyltransferase domain-containing protein [Planctomycetota bacterium]